MTFQVGVVAHFTAQHHLVGDFGPASQPHEHTYRVEEGVCGDNLRADGTVCDITQLQAALNAALAELEGRDLNQIPGLAAPNPTAEVVARYLFERIAPALSAIGLDHAHAQVWVSPEAYACYTGDLA
jgi:6-pyruvoyltetrahydropterin/6-carboxytetrahydropterin synthase